LARLLKVEGILIMRTSPHLGPQQQRGVGLIEALMAFLVLCLGMLALARLQPSLRLDAELSRQRSQASRLAQQEIERLRAFTSLTDPSGASWAAITTGSQILEADNGVRYRIDRLVSPDAGGRAKQVRIDVVWQGREGREQRLALDTVIAGVPPEASGTLALTRRGVAVRGAQQRDAQVPPTARDLGDGRSAFKPSSTGTVAWIFDNRNGRVTAQCSVPAATPSAQLDASQLSNCVRLSGLALSGEVHFADGVPLALDLSVRVDGPTPVMPPSCTTETLKTVAVTTPSGTRLDAVPIDATAESLGLSGWTVRGDPFVAYHCVIVPAPGLLRWSGRTLLTPQGWSVGAGPNERRLCRVTPDLDASGATDQNLEHPAIYENVTGALTRQNFRVVPGHQPCPAGTEEDMPAYP
jgi:Tfp pilus assembly protein PilV